MHTNLELQVWTACRIMSIGLETVTFETEGSSSHMISVAKTDAFPDADDIELAGERAYDVDIMADGSVAIERS